MKKGNTFLTSIESPNNRNKPKPPQGYTSRRQAQITFQKLMKHKIKVSNLPEKNTTQSTMNSIERFPHDDTQKQVRRKSVVVNDDESLLAKTQSKYNHSMRQHLKAQAYLVKTYRQIKNEGMNKTFKNNRILLHEDSSLKSLKDQWLTRNTFTETFNSVRRPSKLAKFDYQTKDNRNN